jgi:hypothetical protein
VSGTQYQGRWQATWVAHDTLDKDYESTLTAVSGSGTQSESRIQWHDKSWQVTLDHPSYTANVGATVSVTANVVCVGTGAPCASLDFTLGIQDNTSGSYTFVPHSDSDIDCNGSDCFTVLSNTFTASLKCEAAGTYNIKGYYGTGPTFSAASTVTCNAVAAAPSVKAHFGPARISHAKF